MNMKRHLFFVFACMAMNVAAARADINIVFENPAQTGVPGSTLQFFADIYNTGPTTVFTNGTGGLNLAGLPGDFTIVDNFIANGPISVAGGGSSGEFDLFDVTVNTPFPDTFTTYAGTYTLLGGVDENAQDVVGSANFSVTAATPEPGYFAVLGTGLALIGWLHRRRGSQTARD
jgi:hypothetical protein